MSRRVYLTDEHQKRLPTVRLHKVVLRNFKSVEYGEIVFDCAKHFIQRGTKSDILGLYGQNGSGKTSFIEALAILRLIMAGNAIDPIYADCIAKGSTCSELEFTFDLQYRNTPISKRKVVYTFLLKVEQLDEVNPLYRGVLQESDEVIDDDEPFDPDTLKRRVIVYNERLSIGGDIDGEKKKLQLVLDTSTSNGVFGPASKRKLFCDAEKNTMNMLEVKKLLASEKSKSFIFCDDTLEIFAQQESYTPYLEVIFELGLFASNYFAVVETKSIAMSQLNIAMPLCLNTPSGILLIKTFEPDKYTIKAYESIKKILSTMSIVLCQLIPNMRIDLKEISDVLLPNGKDGKFAEIVIFRDGVELPIRCISDGAKKLVSILWLLIAAYNRESVTVAIDELDSGIFEYLLGELLQIFEESGKGQLIFTSHNLRPLEVIDKKYICFTTTNPQNRYMRLKNVGASNNLRNLYFREILMGEQDEEIYKATKKQKIVAAFRKAAEE